MTEQLLYVAKIGSAVEHVGRGGVPEAVRADVGDVRHRRDGAVQATVETKVAFTLPPVVANSTLFVLDQKGRIAAYR